MRRTVGLVAVLALLWMPLSYIAFVVSFALLRLAVDPGPAIVLAGVTAVTSATTLVAAIGRSLHAQLHAR